MKTASLPNFLISLSFTLCAGITMSPAIAQPAAGSPQPQPLILWDDRPAGNWMTEAYPIGNGRLGGMAFSDPFHEHIVLNEQSLWTGDEKETGAYQALGDLFIDLDGDQPVSGYRRLLDLDSALLRTSYTRDNIPYQQEYFCSFPDKVMALRFTAGKKGAYSGAIRLKDAHNARTIAGGNYLEMTGQLNNGLKYQARMMVKSLGGKVTTVQDSTGGWEIRLKKADSFTILLVAATDFSNRRSDGWRGEDPVVTNRRTLAAASAKSYAQLLVT
ncbi:MAG: glycoside hydrolase family 95 protein, partial [Bacteroidota bacterium]